MTKLYCDTSNLNDIKQCIKKYKIQGVTTNPSIMRKEGVKKYKDHCIKILKIIKKKPLSIEVFADQDEEMIEQGEIISKWGNNVFVKIPVINTKGKFLKKVIQELNNKKIKLNITAVFTLEQIIQIRKVINKKTPVIVSIFCGRIADNGIDPEPLMIKTKKLFKSYKNVEILWASVREPYNYLQAKQIGCHLITVPPELIEKILKFGKSFDQLTKDTVKAFLLDSKKSKFKI